MEKAAPPSYYSTEVASQPAVISTIYPPVPTIPFGPTPQVVTCPSCHNHATTTIKVEPSSKTHKLAVILCLVCCCLCCLPYCIDSCQNRNHYCQSCGAYLGTYAS